ncbi:M15 family metallopeptidase [Massilia atriviolacea]|uniref:M15 family peptidase n=2 Tax=Massilia atriviolacea TaxID=2495579 RepID=A0A430HFL8_9BURK|nr:M15 family peptidase [Massilia atriviolacea]
MLARVHARVRGWFGQVSRAKGQSVAAIRQTSGNSAREASQFLRRHYLLVSGALVLLSVPPLVAVFSGGGTLSAYEESSRQMDTQVAGLLEGENLVPPAPLPPMLFATVEVEQERPMIVSASRDWTLMHPEYTQRLLQAFKIMKERHGYDMAILEGYRSPERQNKLAAMGSSVTNAAAFQSWHQYGLAADCAFVRNGKIVISEKDPWAMRGYELYGEVAESLGLTWGGRWKMMDFGHTELRLPGVMKRR